MKVLLDTCVWGGAKAEVQAAGHDVLWAGDLAQDPGDEDSLSQARREQRAELAVGRIGNPSAETGTDCQSVVRRTR